jgi:hypothetical protein
VLREPLPDIPNPPVMPSQMILASTIEPSFPWSMTLNGE